MITFNIDKNNRLVDFIYVNAWTYYHENKELVTRISNILKDLTKGTFDDEQVKGIIESSINMKTATIENDDFIVKTIITGFGELKIAVFEKVRNFDTVKFDITPDIEKTIREQFGIK